MNPVLDYQTPPRSPGLWSVLRLSLWATVAAALLFVVLRQIYMRPSGPVRRPGGITVIANLTTGLSVFELDNTRYPTSAEGLEALFRCPPGLEGTWKGPYLEAFPADKWGHPFFYRCPTVTDPTSYDLVSAGADGVLGTEDDIEENGRFDPEGTRPDEQAG